MADKNFLTEIIDADLAAGKVSEIHTRFPPEPNGYLHIGSAKAIYINWSIARAYGGKFNLRLDDTNPAREDVEYVNSILEDLHWLGADPDGGVFYGSDYFEQCYEYAEQLIREGKAYVDDLTRDEMREYRGSDAGKPSRPSPWRDRTPEENLDLFRRMRAGEFQEGEKTLRAKIDLASPNMNLRDPAIYRIKYEHHHRQGDKWCIYPMYDFAHPIQDAIEGITHSMCSLEFENHRPLYEHEQALPAGAGGDGHGGRLGRPPDAHPLRPAPPGLHPHLHLYLCAGGGHLQGRQPDRHAPAGSLRPQ